MLDQSVSAISSSSSSSSLWSSFTSCFTPTVLFLLLNLMIAAIAVISALSRHHPPHHSHFQHQPPPPHEYDHVSIARTPSIIQRLKSINFYRSFHEPPISSLLHKPSADYSQFQTFLPAHNNPQGLQEVHNNIINNNNDDGYGGSSGGDCFIDEQNQQQIDAQFDGFNPQATNGEENGHEFESMDEIYSKLKGVQFGRTKSDKEPASTRNPPRIRRSASMKPPSAAALRRSKKATDAVEAPRPAAARERVLAKVTDGDEEVDAKADDFINRFRQQLKIQRLDSILKYKDKIRAGFGAR